MDRTNILVKKQMNGYEVCADCGELIEDYDEWEGEDNNGIGHYTVTYRCVGCSNWVQTIEPE